MIDEQGSHIFRPKGNAAVATDLDNAASTYGDLVEQSAILEFYTDHLIADTGLFRFLQLIRKPAWNRNLMRPDTPPGSSFALETPAATGVQEGFKGVGLEEIE
jgi:hypothetical protein